MDRCFIICMIISFLVATSCGIGVYFTITHMRDGCPIRNNCTMVITPDSHPCFSDVTVYIDGVSTKCATFCDPGTCAPGPGWQPYPCSHYSNNSHCNLYGPTYDGIQCPGLDCLNTTMFITWLILVIAGLVGATWIALGICAVIGVHIVDRCKDKTSKPTMKEVTPLIIDSA